MRVLCCPDSFKESISATDAAAAMARGVRAAGAEADVCPLADGGEGMVEALVAATGGAMRTSRVTGPLGEPVDAAWGLLPDGGAVIELASAAGLAQVPVARRDPTKTTTFGVGELIRAALDAGATRIILGIGGSATTDGGTGAAQALGVRFIDAQGMMTGGQLARVTAIDPSALDPRLRRVTITVACDVTNPLTGPNGAAAIYGPQKGATPAQVCELDDGLQHLASLLPVDSALPGMGAAGGFGFGAVAFLGATLRRGIELVLDAAHFDARVAMCDLVLTGEGKLDAQTMSGKTIAGVLQWACGKRVVALVGRVEGEPPCEYRVIGQGLSSGESMRRAGELIERAARDVVAG